MACKRSTVRSRLAPPTFFSERLGNTVTPVNAYHFCGAIAQLGERLHGMQEVDGSRTADPLRVKEMLYQLS